MYYGAGPAAYGTYSAWALAGALFANNFFFIFKPCFPWQVELATSSELSSLDGAIGKADHLTRFCSGCSPSSWPHASSPALGVFCSLQLSLCSLVSFPGRRSFRKLRVSSMEPELSSPHILPQPPAEYGRQRRIVVTLRVNNAWRFKNLTARLYLLQGSCIPGHSVL
ncbi:hypothetical protein VTI74DRAFT_4956 [Chaetomium olivicolor]